MVVLFITLHVHTYFLILWPICRITQGDDLYHTRALFLVLSMHFLDFATLEYWPYHLLGNLLKYHLIYQSCI